MQKTFRATFGDTVTLVNAPLQMQRNLAELRHAAGLPMREIPALLNLAGRSLAALPAAVSAAMHLKRVGWI